MEHTIATAPATIETNNELFIMPGHLAAVAMFAAKKDVRFYLMGVCIDTGPNGAFLVATCGHTVAVHQIDTVARPEGQFIMPLEPLASMLKVNRKNAVKLTLPDVFSGKYDSAKNAKRHVTLESNKSGMVTINELDGIFPDWRRVAKHDDTPYPHQVFFNVNYLMRVADAADVISTRNFPIQVRPGGLGCGFAQLDHEGKTVAYVMPLRATLDELPSKPSMTY